MAVSLTRLYPVGSNWTRAGRSGTTAPPPPPPPGNPSRFPGDPNPNVTGKFVWGLDEFDKDGYAKHVSEVSTPEATAATPAGSMRGFFSGSDSLVPPNGGAVAFVKEMHAKGRIPWVSTTMTNWAVQADGRNNAAWDAFIKWVEESAAGPVWFTIQHEPEDNTTSMGGSAGTEAQYYAMQKAFRSRMTAYANTRGGVATYKWKNLAFAPILTAFAWARKAGTAGSASLYLPSTVKTDKTFDFIGVDYYIGGQSGAIGSPAWGGNIVAVVNWNKAYDFPLGIAETGVNRRDPDAATKIQELVNRSFDGTNDIICWNYYNSSVGSTVATEQRWLLDNVSNGGLLDKWVSILKGTRSIHFWEMKSPQTGANYPRPAGV